MTLEASLPLDDALLRQLASARGRGDRQAFAAALSGLSNDERGQVARILKAEETFLDEVKTLVESLPTSPREQAKLIAQLAEQSATSKEIALGALRHWHDVDLAPYWPSA
jgi:hypothetical protein